MGYKKYTTNVYFYDNVEPYKSNKTAHKSCTNEIQLSYVLRYYIIKMSFLENTTNYIQYNYKLFPTISNIHEYVKILFRCRKYVSYSAENKKNLGNLCQKSISKCNAIYSWKKRLLWCKFNIFQYDQFPTYYIKYNSFSQAEVKLSRLINIIT